MSELDTVRHNIKPFYIVSLRLIVTNDIEKNIAVRTMIRASDQRRFGYNSPLISALVR